VKILLPIVAVGILVGSILISNSANAQGEPDFPQSIALDPSKGNVFVGVIVDPTNGGNDKIQKFSNNGTFIGQWDTSSPQGVAVDKSGMVFVLDRDNKQVIKYNNVGKFIRQFGNKGSGDGQFTLPRGIAVDPSGNVFVADFVNGNIQKFTNTGKFIKKWAIRGPDDPLGIAADPSNGNVFVITEFKFIQKYSNNGKFIREWKKDDVSRYMGIAGIAVDNSGNVFVVTSRGDNSDWERNMTHKYSNTGKFIRSWGNGSLENGQFNDPRGIATDSTGNVFVVDPQNQNIQKFTNTGKFIRQWNATNTTIANVNVFAMRE
jgi:tripartite motif-containing protein 71